MNSIEFAKKLIDMVPSDRIEELLDLLPEVATPLKKAIANHVQTVAKESILAKTEVHDDGI